MHRSKRSPIWTLLCVLLVAACRVVEPTATPVNSGSDQELALATVTPSPRPTETEVLPDGPYPPRIVAFEPQPGEEVGTDTTLTWTFSEPMDQQSVERALRLLPETSGRFTWVSDHVVAFSPDELVRGQRYTVSFAADVRSVAGLPLSGNPEYAFHTLSTLQVTRLTPPDGATEIRADAPILIEFNRPVAPLNCVGGPAQPDTSCPVLPLSFDPPATGNGVWVDTSTYRFAPSPGLQAGIRYGLVLAENVQSTDGAQLVGPYEWSFETATPRVSRVIPAPGTRGALLEAGVQISFSTPMDPASTGAAFSLIAPGGDSVPGSLTWQDRGATLVFTPTELLDLGATYTATIEPGARAATSAPIEAPYSWTFSTVPYPRLVSHVPVADAQAVDVYDPVRLTFVGQIDPDELAASIRVTPAPPANGLYAWYDAPIGVFTLSWVREPRTETCIAIDPALSDIYGNPIAQPEDFCFVTGDLPPLLALTSAVDAITLHAGLPATVQLLNRNVDSARFRLARIALPQFVTGGVDSGDLVREWTASFETSPNTAQVVTVSLDRSGGALATGLYALSWQLTGIDAPQGVVRIAVVDRHVLIKLASEEALVWVTEMDAGAPVTRTAVQLLDREALLLAGGTTDSDGISRLPVSKRSELWEPVAAVTGEPGEPGYGIAVSTWQGDVFPWDFGIDVHTTAQPAYRAYFELDRKMYRPGDTAHYSGVLRRDRSGSYELPEPDSSVVLNLRGPSGEVVLAATTSISSSGVFSGTFAIPRDGALGDYTVLVSAISANAGESSPEVVAEAGFLVAAYRKPSYEVVVTPATPLAIFGEPVRFTVDARYFAGGQVTHGKVEWSLTALPYDPSAGTSFMKSAMQGWQWGMPRRSYERIAIAQGSGETDANGLFAVTVGPESMAGAAQTGGSQVWHLEANVTDGDGLPIAGSASVLLHQADYILAMRPESWVVRVGERTDLCVMATDWSGEGLQGVELRLAVYRRTYGAPLPDSSRTVSETVILEESLTTDVDGQGVAILRLAQAGEYVARVTAADPGGHEAAAEVVFMVGSGQGSVLPHQAEAKLRLSLDAQSYAVGDRARVLIPVTAEGPYQLLLTVEREGILWTHTQMLDRPNPVIEIPVMAEFAPTAYVSSFVVVPGGTGESFAAVAGYAALNVETDSRRLEISIVPDRDTYGPGEEARLAFTVTDADGVPQEANVTVAVVDAAAPDPAVRQIAAPFLAFYAPRPLRVITGDGLLVAMDQSPLTTVEAEALANRYFGAPRGMGGGGDNETNSLQPRAGFPDIALYQAGIPTGRDGTAELKFELPDSLTLWEVRAWAVTQDTKLGQADTQLLVSKPLSIEPVTPQFLVAGDRAELTAVVRNDTGGTLSVEATLNASDALGITSPQTLEIPVGPGERQRVAWMVTALSAQEATDAALVFSARSGELFDASSVTVPALPDGLFPIRGLTARESAGVAGMLEATGNRMEVVVLPQDAGAQSEVALRVDTSLTSVVLAGLEQVGLPSTAWSTDNWASELQAATAARVIQGSGGGSDPTLAMGGSTAAGALEQLYQRQNPDGGWGWRERTSNLHLTTYVVNGLIEAQRAGFPVRSTALDGGLSYIQELLARGIEAGLRQPHLAFALHVLAEAQQSWPQGAGTALYADRDKIGIGGRAYLALAFGALDRSDTRLASLLAEVRDAAIVSGSGAHWEEADAESWSTSVQSTALALKVLVRYASEDPLLPDVVRWLVASRGNRVPATSYENAWVLSALADYATVNGDLSADYDWHVILNGTTVLEGPGADQGGATVVFDLSAPGGGPLRRGPNVVEIAHGTGPGRLYYTLQLRAVLPVDLDTRSERRGMALSRQYCAAREGSAMAIPDPVSDVCLPVSELQVGDPVEVRLTVVLPESRHYLKVEDPFPAGLSPDTFLPTANGTAGNASIGVVPDAGLGSSRDVGALGLPDLLDDRAIFRTEHLAPGTYRASYRLRATTPGLFHALPAVAEEVYFPEVWASTTIDVLEIRPHD